MSNKINLGVYGACGRMGRRVVQLAADDPQLKITGAYEFPDHPNLRQDIGELCGIGPIKVPVHAEIGLEPLNVVIDFSTPEGTMLALKSCVARRIPLLVAATGHSPAQMKDIRAAAHETAVMKAPNLSLAMNLLMQLLSTTAAALKEQDFDVEIIEKHHRFKKDAPSGTALHLADIIQRAMGQTKLRHGREGLVGERLREEIGIHAVRTGDNVGEHNVLFSTLGETLELTHRAHSRDCYVRGALQAARFLASRPPGWYEMKEVLGF